MLNKKAVDLSLFGGSIFILGAFLVMLLFESFLAKYLPDIILYSFGLYLPVLMFLVNIGQVIYSKEITRRSLFVFIFNTLVVVLFLIKLENALIVIGR